MKIILFFFVRNKIDLLVLSLVLKTVLLLLCDYWIKSDYEINIMMFDLSHPSTTVSTLCTITKILCTKVRLLIRVSTMSFVQYRNVLNIVSVTVALVILLTGINNRTLGFDCVSQQ